mmetsp:Transcript_18571/g.62244  ORF Transcript_18571/g.62244 Transcript_18571/m.62244 type:complete len:207 (-) Transcript_18571:347-967(-)
MVRARTVRAAAHPSAPPAHGREVHAKARRRSSRPLSRAGLCVRGSESGMCEVALDLLDGLARVEVLRARLRAVHDGVAAVHLVGVVQEGEALLGGGVTRVGDPPVRLEEHRGPQVLVRVPPVGRARGGAAGAEHALVEAVQLGPVLLGLAVLRALLRALGHVEPGLHALVLRVEVVHVRQCGAGGRSWWRRTPPRWSTGRPACWFR